MKKELVVVIGCCMSMGNALAEAIKGEAELGFVSTSGNTETENINAKLKLLKETDNWRHEGNIAALSSSSEDQDTGEASTTAEKYTADAKSERKLSERAYVYGLATYEDDRFSGFDYQATVGAGYGYEVIATENKTLALEIGPGYRYSAVENGEDEDEATLRLGEEFEWQFSDTAKFNQYLVVEGGDDNTITNVGVSLESALTGTLALKIGIDAEYTDEVPVDDDGIKREHTDTETYASIIYSF
jgi:putative salt-induced outer membrane protein